MSRIERIPGLRKKFIAMVEAGATRRELARAFGVCEETVCNWKHLLGLPIGALGISRIDKDPALREQFTAMVKSGASYAKLAKEFGISEATVPEWKKKLGLPLDRNVGHRHRQYYTVYLRRDDTPVCHGYVEDCTKALGMTRSNFYSMVFRSLNGGHGKYEVAVETVLPGTEAD